MIQDEPASNLYFTGSAVVHGSVQITGSRIFLPPLYHHHDRMHACNYHVKNFRGGFGDSKMRSTVRKKRKVNERILESIRRRSVDSILAIRPARR